MKNKPEDHQPRVVLMIALASVVLVLFLLRLVYLQVIEGNHYLEQADNTTSYRFNITAARGEIVDCYGRSLATNTTGYNLVMNNLMLGDNDLNDTLKTLVEMGHPDVGFGMTVQDMNCEDLVPLYKLSDEMGMEFATATLHNSFYFRKTDNKIDDKYHVAQNFEALINELLQSKSPKKWFRAYFNHGLINYIYGNKRLLPCDMSKDAFFIDPFCDVIPCNGMAKKAVMGNLKESPDWDTLWNSEQAKTVRAQTKQCDRNCWMIGSVSPAMHKYIWVPGWWVVKHKFLKGGKYSLSENAFIPEAQKK